MSAPVVAFVTKPCAKPCLGPTKFVTTVKVQDNHDAPLKTLWFYGATRAEAEETAMSYFTDKEATPC